MKLKKGNAIVGAFTDEKIRLVNEVLLYYTFLYQDDEDALAKDPTQWKKRNFKKWKSRGYPLSTDAYNALKAGSNTNVTLNTTNTAATPKTKLQDDAWLSWRRSKQDETAYPLLKAGRMYTNWIIKFKRKIASEKMSRMIDKGFHKNQLSAGSDTELFKQQENHLSSVLERVLQTSEEKRLTRKNPDDPRIVWELHEAHSTSSATSTNICTSLGQELANLKIVTFDTPTTGLDTFDSYFNNFNKIDRYRYI